MKQNKIALKTLGIKARVYNTIRTFLYKKRLENISVVEKVNFFDDLFKLNHEAHWELNNYKQKRKDQTNLLNKRLTSPQTKSMLKKINRNTKINLVDSKK